MEKIVNDILPELTYEEQVSEYENICKYCGVDITKTGIWECTSKFCKIIEED